MKEKAVQHLKNLSASKILAVLFLVFLLYIGSAAVPQLLSNSGIALEENKTFSQFIELIDEQYHGMLSLKTDQDPLHIKSTYINFNGYIAKLMGQQEMNERYKLKNGHMHQERAAISEELFEDIYQNLLLLDKRQKDNGKNFLFVLAPFQLYQYEDLMPIGFTDYYNEIGDRLIARLEESGVLCLDLRKTMEQAGFTNEEAFFITDHHWKPETGFWAYGNILEKLAENGSISPVNTFYTDPENFNFTVYEDAFLGSSGKRTGIYYAGVDDFCLITPKFDTEISLTIDNSSINISGTFPEVAFRSDATAVCEKRDYFNQNPYGIYGRGDNGLMHWDNENAPEQQKVMLIGDSYGNVPFSFMSLYFSSCKELDMRYFKRDFAEFYNEYSPDHFIVLVNLFSINTRNLLYDFFPESDS